MGHYLKEAIRTRKSRRTFQGLPLKKKDADTLNKWIDRFNEESQLKMVLVEIDENLFKGFSSSLGVFKGVSNYIAVVGDDDIADLEAKAGYYGELVVLEATNLGLATCWIGGSFKKQRVYDILNLNEDERLLCIIAVGYAAEKKSLREMIVSKATSFKPRKLEEVFKHEGECPVWVLNGMELVMLAPSSSNSQPIVFTYANEKIVANIQKYKDFKYIDLGIALVHFEIGAGVGRWYKENGAWTFMKFEQITEN